MQTPAKQKRFTARRETGNGLPAKSLTFEVIERDTAGKLSVCYGGFLRKVIAEGVAEMLNADPEISWKDIQAAFANERRLCI